jgi:hypothetical protein
LATLFKIIREAGSEVSGWDFIQDMVSSPFKDRTDASDGFIPGTPEWWSLRRTENDYALVFGIEANCSLSIPLMPQVTFEYCIKRNQLVLARYLLSSGRISIKERPHSSWSLLHLAAALNRVEFIHLLVTEGMLDINERGGSCRYTPLHQAVHRDCLSATRALLELGADVHARCIDSTIDAQTGTLTPLGLYLTYSQIRLSLDMLVLLRGHGATLEEDGGTGESYVLFPL